MGHKDMIHHTQVPTDTEVLHTQEVFVAGPRLCLLLKKGV